MFIRHARRHLYFRRINVCFASVYGKTCAYVGDLRITLRGRVPTVFLDVFIARLGRLFGFPFKIGIRREGQRLAQVRDFLYRTGRGEEVLSSAVGRREVLGFHDRFTSGIGKLDFRFFRIARFVLFFRCVLVLWVSCFCLFAFNGVGSDGQLASSSDRDFRMSGSETKYDNTSGKTRVPMGFLVSPLQTLTCGPFASHFSRSTDKILACVSEGSSYPVVLTTVSQVSLLKLVGTTVMVVPLSVGDFRASTVQQVFSAQSTSRGPELLLVPLQVLSPSEVQRDGPHLYGSHSGTVTVILFPRPLGPIGRVVALYYFGDYSLSSHTDVQSGVKWV